MKTKNNNIEKKNASYYATGLIFYSFTSLIFLIIVTRINGVEDAGIYSFGFGFASMIQVIATYAGRTFQVTERKKGIHNSDFLIFKIINCLIMIIVGLCFCALRSYDIYKISIIMILVCYRALDAYSESIFAIFQKNNDLYRCGISMLVKSISCILGFTVVDFLFKNLLIGVLAILLIDIFIFVIYDLRLLKRYKIKFHRLKFDTVKYLTIAGFSIFIMLLLAQYINMAQKYVIDYIMTNEDQAIFGIIVMPATFVGMCAAMIINPFLYRMNKAVETNDYRKFNHIVLKIIIYVVVIGAIVLVVTYLVGIPILNFIYGLELSEFLWPLMIIVFSSIGTAISAVISNAMIAIRRNTSQMIIYIVASIFTTLVSLFFIHYYGLFGAAMSFASTMLLITALYILIYMYIINKLIK